MYEYFWNTSAMVYVNFLFNNYMNDIFSNDYFYFFRGLSEKACAMFSQCFLQVKFFYNTLSLRMKWL